MGKGILFDSTLCVACGACTEACKAENHLPASIDPVPTANTWTTVDQTHGVNLRKMCMHCLEPTCESVCPVAAIQRQPEGPVVYLPERCIGCRYCIQACPFDVPKYQWHSPTPVMGKCQFCPQRVKNGQPSACAEACPTGATLFGDRDELLQEARKRIATKPRSAAQPDGYCSGIYGYQEAGGTSVMILASKPFQEIGLRSIGSIAPPRLTWQVLEKIPDFVMVAGATLFGIHWITARRDEVKGAGHE